MNRLFITSLLLTATALCTSAQTFLQHLQQSKQGQGKVVVRQSKDIDDLVNGTVRSTTTPTTSSERKSATTHEKATAAHEKAVATAHEKTATTHEKSAATTATPSHKSHTATTEQPNKDVETETTPVDMRKKVMRRSYKTNGYRIQVFAGGNSRSDKIKAQKAGNSVKQAFPEQPIYVHFYSPRWICRMGNYRTYEEASELLRQVKLLGFSEACIVSGKIVVPY